MLYAVLQTSIVFGLLQKRTWVCLFSETRSYGVAGLGFVVLPLAPKCLQVAALYLTP